MTSPSPTSLTRRSRRRAVLIIVATATLLLFMTVGLAATCRPAWYRPPAIDHNRLRADKAALFALQDDISAALNAGRPATFTLDEHQLNRWLAARHALWPDATADVPALRDPLVESRPGEFRVAATVHRGNWRAVVTVAAAVRLDPDQVVIELRSARLGVLPIPRHWILGALPPHPDVRITSGAGAVALRNDWIWPNGKRRCRLVALEIEDGRARVTLGPYAPP